MTSARTAASFLTSDDSLGVLARNLGIALEELVDLLRNPEATRILDAAIALTEIKIHLRALESQPAALRTLDSVCTSPKADPVERRRAATSLIRAGNRRPRYANPTAGTSSRRRSPASEPPRTADAPSSRRLKSQPRATGGSSHRHPPNHAPQPGTTQPRDASPEPRMPRRKSGGPLVVPDMAALGPERAHWLDPQLPIADPNARKLRSGGPITIPRPTSPAALAARSGAPPPINSPDPI